MSQPRNPFGALPLDALGARDTALEPGQTLGRYEIVEEISRKDGHRDYRALHTELASKHVVRLVFVHSPSVRKRLVFEGQTQSKLVHPNIVSVTDAIEVDDGAAIVFEQIDGVRLRDVLDDRLLDLREAVRLAAGIASGLDYAHQEGLVHRDLRPENIFVVTVNDVTLPKITGFALAAQGEGPSAVAATAKTMGTPHYAAPEQIRDARRVDARSDLWAFGVVLYEMLAGRRPFEGESFEVIAAVKSAARTPLDEHGRDVPASLVELVDSLLQVEPSDRPPSAAELLLVLGAVDRQLATPIPVERRSSGEPLKRRFSAVRPERVATLDLFNATLLLVSVAVVATLLALGLAVGAAL